MEDIVIPSLGIAMEEAMLVQWLKQPGEEVAVDEPVAEIETDKATIELKSPVSGRLGPHLYEAGVIVPVGAAIVAVITAGPAQVNRAGPARPPTARQDAPPASPEGNAASAGAEAAAGPRGERYRELIATKVSASWREIPHFSVTREIDAEPVLALLGRLRAGAGAPVPTLTDLLLRALALALGEAASSGGGAGGRADRSDVGLAVATESGVVIAVVENVLALGPAELARARAAAVQRARSRQLNQADLEARPSSTLSNLGAHGVDSFTGIIAAGQTSLLTVGRAAPRVVAGADREPIVKTTLFATLNVDHRYIDGAGAARLVVSFATAVESMVPFSGATDGDKWLDAGDGGQVMVTTAALPAKPEALIEIDLDGTDGAGDDGDGLAGWLQDMLVIREFEESLETLTTTGKIPGGAHQATGQEAVAVGVMRALKPSDIVASPHRPHHHALAKGLTARAVMAELWGRATGCAGGRGGTMHLSDFSLGYFGSNGIVGASLGIAMGAALAAKLRHLDQVCVGFFGDGGANTGRTWEFINFAAVQALPLIAICENNQYAVETYTGRATAGSSIAERAAGFGLPSRQVDGQDVASVYRATTEARRRAASGGGPTFIEAVTYRYRGHNTGEVVNYRTAEEVEHWRQTRDPVERLRSSLQGLGLLGPAEFDGMVAKARAIVQDAIDFAESSPPPDPAGAADGVTNFSYDVKGPAWYNQ